MKHHINTSQKYTEITGQVSDGKNSLSHDGAQLYVSDFIMLDLLLYFHGKQLKSCCNGQLSSQLFSWADSNKAGG